MEKEERVLAMYDVRGIQRYIYRTSKLKDAMGASRLVEDIIPYALEYACKSLQEEGTELDAEIRWEGESSPLLYRHDKPHDVQVLYIGGGNAYVSFCNASLCQRVNKKMAKYVLEQTYSLQLAAAYIPMTDNYAQDYKALFGKMNQVKSEMTASRPLGTLPVMQAELKTGFPVADLSECTKDKNCEGMSRETYLKWNKKNRKIQEDDIDKILDNLAKRGQESRIAVVHIDGNNMGLRIRKLVEDTSGYQEAVTRMRQISHNIKYSYLNTFQQMKEKFEKIRRQDSLAKRFVRKVVVAGDDITYVCNAHIAMETVAWFCQKISGMTMNAGVEKNASQDCNSANGISEADIQEYGFSVCAGIAYIRSHFPFGTAYEVAEGCCDIAKDMAKSKEHKAYFRVLSKGKLERIDYQEYQEGCGQAVQGSYPYYFEKTGNFFDFQICKNIQCLDLKKIREEEFLTASGESLLIRPYYVPMQREDDPLNQANRKPEGSHYNDYGLLKHDIAYFSDQGNIPRSFAKKIRNTYSQGRNQMELLAGFLDSRGWKMPDGQGCAGNMYLEGRNVARWYDALEVVDYNLSESVLEKGGETNEAEKD